MSLSDAYFSRFTTYSNEVTGRTATGGVVRTLVVKQASTPCYLTLLSAKEQYAYGQRNMIATHLLMCDVFDVKSSDVIVVGTKSFQIVQIENADDIFHHLEIVLFSVLAPQSFSSTPPEAP